MSRFIISKKFLALVLFGFFAFLAPQAMAVVIIDNYPPANDGAATTIATGPPVTGDLSKAAGFTLPAGTDYSLDSVTLRLRRFDADATIQVDLFGDVGGSPGGAALVSFIVPAFGLGISDVVFLPMTPFTLLASTTYWIAATGVSPTLFGVNWLASDPGIAPTGIASNAGYRVNDTGIYPPTGPSDILNTYQVDATAVAAVPEPATALLLSAGLAGLAFVRRKKV